MPKTLKDDLLGFSMAAALAAFLALVNLAL